MSPFQCLHLAFLKLRICSFTCVYVHNQLCLTLCDPMDYTPQGSSVHGIFQARNTGVSCHFLLQGKRSGREAQ